MTSFLHGLQYGTAAGQAQGQAFARGQALNQQDAFKAEILDLKQRIAGIREVKDVLKAALAAVAPDHPLVNPLLNNPELIATYEKGAEKVTRWDDEV